MSPLIVPPRIIIFIFLLFVQHSLQAEECAGQLKPKVVRSTSINSAYPASSVLILAEENAEIGNGKYNFWLAEYGKTTGQGLTLRVDDCPRLIAGCQIKNLGKGGYNWATKDFKISGSQNKNGPWETLVEDKLVDTSRGQSASLLNFTFEEPVEIQFLKFDLVSYWGGSGGGLQYFGAIPATSGPLAETTTHSAIGTTTVDITNTDKEPSLDYEIPIWFYFLISIPIAFTIFGLGYMIRTNCKIRQKCCKCCVDLEKEDQNLDYYYADDGERRHDVMEVQDRNPAYETAYTESNMGSQVIDKNPQYEDHENKNPPSNSVDQLDDYDYMGN